MDAKLVDIIAVLIGDFLLHEMLNTGFCIFMALWILNLRTKSIGQAEEDDVAFNAHSAGNADLASWMTGVSTATMEVDDTAQVLLIFVSLSSNHVDQQLIVFWAFNRELLMITLFNPFYESRVLLGLVIPWLHFSPHLFDVFSIDESSACEL